MPAVLATPPASASYAPSSLAHRLLKYFEGYPTIVSITTDDIADRFIFSQSGVHSALELALEKGDVKRDREYVYFPGWFDAGGKPLGRAAAHKAANNATVQALQTVMKGKRKEREPLIDVDKIEVELGVPIPKKQTSNDWAGLLKRVPAGGSVHLNMAHFQNVRKHAKASGRSFHIIQDADGAKFRIWMEPSPA
jgi:hypothetical protein